MDVPKRYAKGKLKALETAAPDDERSDTGVDGDEEDKAVAKPVKPKHKGKSSGLKVSHLHTVY